MQWLKNFFKRKPARLDEYDRLAVVVSDMLINLYDEQTHAFIYPDGEFNIERAKECRRIVAMAFESHLDCLDLEISVNGLSKPEDDEMPKG